MKTLLGLALLFSGSATHAAAFDCAQNSVLDTDDMTSASEQLERGLLAPDLLPVPADPEAAALASEISRCGIGMQGPLCGSSTQFHPVTGGFGCKVSSDRLEYYSVFASRRTERLYFLHLDFDRSGEPGAQSAQLKAIDIRASENTGGRQGRLASVIETPAESSPLQFLMPELQASGDPTRIVWLLSRTLERPLYVFTAQELFVLTAAYPIAQVDRLQDIYKESYVVSLQTLWLGTDREEPKRKLLLPVLGSPELRRWLDPARRTLSRETAVFLGLLGEASPKILRILRQTLAEKTGSRSLLARAALALERLETAKAARN